MRATLVFIKADDNAAADADAEPSASEPLPTFAAGTKRKVRRQRRRQQREQLLYGQQLLYGFC